MENFQTGNIKQDNPEPAPPGKSKANGRPTFKPTGYGIPQRKIAKFFGISRRKSTTTASETAIGNRQKPLRLPACHRGLLDRALYLIGSKNPSFHHRFSTRQKPPILAVMRAAVSPNFYH